MRLTITIDMSGAAFGETLYDAADQVYRMLVDNDDAGDSRIYRLLLTAADLGPAQLFDEDGNGCGSLRLED